MKKKVIAIVIAVVIIAGVGTTVGIVVDKNNEKEAASMVDEAVSKALSSTTQPTTKATTTTTTTQPATQTTAQRTITAQTTTEKETATEIQVFTVPDNTSTYTNVVLETYPSYSANGKTNESEPVNNNPLHAIGGIIESSNGINYFATNLTTHDDNQYPIYVDVCSDLFYFKDNIVDNYRIQVDRNEYN